MTIKVRNIDQVFTKIKAFSNQTTKALKQNIASAAFRYELDLKKEINTGSRSGIVYKRGSVSHQSSAPGEPPKSDEGQLVNSIHTVTTKQGLGAEIKSNLRYATTLELGTTNIAARPAWLPVAERLKPIFSKELGLNLKVVVKRNAKK